MSKFGWNIKNKLEDDEDSAELELYGDVSSYQLKEWNDDFSGLKNSQCICPEGFLEALKGLEGKKNLTVRLNTLGGDAVTGFWIYNKLKSLGATITMINEGIAASAGSVIFMAGTQGHRQVYNASDIMIHGVSMYMDGWYNADEMKKVTRSVDAFNQLLVNVYVSGTGQSEEKIRGFLQRETHFVGQDAVNNGFADEVIDGEISLSIAASAKGTMIVDKNGHAIVADFFLPERVRKLMKTVEATDDSTDDSIVNAGDSGETVDEITIKAKGGTEMEINSLDELKRQYPDMCASIAEEAKNTVDKTTFIAAERKRIQDIDAIAFKIADKALIDKAKYETGETAESLLMKDALAEKDRIKATATQLNIDVANSGVNNVHPSVSNTLEDVTKAEKPMSIADKIAKGRAEAEALKGGK